MTTALASYSYVPQYLVPNVANERLAEWSSCVLVRLPKSLELLAVNKKFFSSVACTTAELPTLRMSRDERHGTKHSRDAFRKLLVHGRQGCQRISKTGTHHGCLSPTHDTVHENKAKDPSRSSRRGIDRIVPYIVYYRLMDIFPQKIKFGWKGSTARLPEAVVCVTAFVLLTSLALRQNLTFIHFRNL